MKKSKRIIKIAFWIYMFILISILVFKFPTGMVKNALLGLMEGKELHRSPMQLVPFKTIIEYTANVHSLTDWFIKNLACNIIMFMPMGVFLPLLYGNVQLDKGKNEKRAVSIMICGKKMSPLVAVAMAGFILSFVIELIQYVTCLGLCDIDDVILNTAGGMLGYWVFCWIQKIGVYHK